MKAFRVFAAALLALGTAAAPAWSKRPRSGIPSPDFDGKPVGARFIGLGETGAAVFGAPESPVWNPAALRDMPGPALSVDFDVARHSRLDDDVLLGDVPLRGRKLTYIGFAGPNGAFFYRPLAAYNETVVTDAADPANNFIQESLKVNQLGIGLSEKVGKEGENSMGLNISFLNARRGFARAETGRPPVLELADGNGFSLDWALYSKTDVFSYGLAVFNAPGIVYWNAYRPDQLPVLGRAGVSFRPIPVFNFATDYEKRFYRGGLPQPDLWHLGMELALLSGFQLRGGTYGEDLNDVDKTSYTGGFSAVSARRFQLDFALRTYRVRKERVYNYFLSLIVPMASERRR
ncbi:MAG: hypothetical protein ACT4O3_09845 [Elusimicrobiota bacterium]